jgi:hypothetical protein
MRHFGTWKKALKRTYDYVSSLESEPSGTHENIVLNNAQGSKKQQGSLSLRKRFFVMKRDSFTCVLCGANGLGVRLEVDHRIPRAQGGSDSLDNLQTLCFNCNRGKRDSLK